MTADQLNDVFLPTIRARRPLRAAPRVDQSARRWTRDEVIGFWRRIGHDAMLQALGVLPGGGCDRDVYDEARHRIEDLAHKVSCGTFIQMAHDGVRQGFVDAACDLWRAVARAEMSAVGPDGDGEPVRFQLEREMRLWCRDERPLAARVAEALNDGFAEAYLVDGPATPPYLALVQSDDPPVQPRHRRMYR